MSRYHVGHLSVPAWDAVIPGIANKREAGGAVSYWLDWHALGTSVFTATVATLGGILTMGSMSRSES